MKNYGSHLDDKLIINIISIYAVPTKRSSHYMKGVLIGATATLGLALVLILSFLWIRLLSKKERAAKKYTEVKKQVDPEASKKGGVSNLTTSY